MDGFGTIRLHHRTIKRFRWFSKKIRKSYSETLEIVMDFFEWHGITPSSRFAKDISAEEEKTRKRINALIAIIKDIEKTQIKPTNKMLEALFGQHEIIRKKKVPAKVEKINKKLTEFEWDKLQGKVSQEKYDLLKEKYKGDNKRVLEFLSKVEFVKPRFGNPYWKIDTTANELAFLKNRLSRYF
tara:strand:+ start:1602 stop:2153 length:552 start_codon:yes stop_codon:yes gene_type:complete